MNKNRLHDLDSHKFGIRSLLRRVRAEFIRTSTAHASTTSHKQSTPATTPFTAARFSRRSWRTAAPSSATSTPSCSNPPPPPRPPRPTTPRWWPSPTTCAGDSMCSSPSYARASGSVSGCGGRYVEALLSNSETSFGYGGVVSPSVAHTHKYGFARILHMTYVASHLSRTHSIPRLRFGQRVQEPALHQWHLLLGSLHATARRHAQPGGGAAVSGWSGSKYDFSFHLSSIVHAHTYTQVRCHPPSLTSGGRGRRDQHHPAGPSFVFKSNQSCI